MIMLIAAGILSGIVSGMGVGGGVILIPILTSFFGISQRNAQYINLLYFIPVALCALCVHAKNKNLDCKSALYMILGGVLSCILGSSTAMKISMTLLRKLFGYFLFVVGFLQFKKPSK